MRLGGGDGADNLVQVEDTGQEEKCVAIDEHPGGPGSEKTVHAWKDRSIGESIGEMVNWGEGAGGEKMVVGRENVRLKLALVECRLLLHDQVAFMGMIQ